MITFTTLPNSIRIDTEDKSLVFPKNKLVTITSDNSTSVTLRLTNSRKNVLSFVHTECNLAGASPEETAKKIAEIL